MPSFRAVEVDPTTGRPVGAARELSAATRREAATQLLAELGFSEAEARLGPNGVMVFVGQRAWTLVAHEPPSAREAVSPRLRRAGAKHRRTA